MPPAVRGIKRQRVGIDHNEEDVPDKEAGSPRRATGRREGRMFVLGVLIGFVRDALPRLDVTVKLPFLLVDERLHVDARYLAVVLLQVQLRLGPLRRDRQRQILHKARLFKTERCVRIGLRTFWTTWPVR